MGSRKRERECVFVYVCVCDMFLRGGANKKERAEIRYEGI